MRTDGRTHVFFLVPTETTVYHCGIVLTKNVCFTVGGNYIKTKKKEGDNKWGTADCWELCSAQLWMAGPGHRMEIIPHDLFHTPIHSPETDGCHVPMSSRRGRLALGSGRCFRERLPIEPSNTNETPH